MINITMISNSPLPFVYEADAAPYCQAFIIGPDSLSQQSLVLAPSDMAPKGALIKENLASDLKKGTVSFQRFQIADHVLSCVTMPTALTDEMGRLGLYLTIGVRMSSANFGDGRLESTLGLAVHLVNLYFHSRLPSSDVEKVITALDSFKTDKQTSASLDFEIFTHAFIAALQLMSAESVRRVPHRRWRSFLNGYLARPKAKSKVPSLVICPPDTDLLTLGAALLRQCANTPTSVIGQTRGGEPAVNVNSQTVKLMTVSDRFPLDLRAIHQEQVAGQTCLFLYSTDSTLSRV
jgi:hypothetical protein